VGKEGEEGKEGAKGSRINQRSNLSCTVAEDLIFGRYFGKVKKVEKGQKGCG